MSLWSVERAVRAAAADAYASCGVTPTQGKLLQALAQTPSTSQAALAQRTGVDAALTGRVIDELVGGGFVLRKQSADDRRRYVLSLSAAGKRKAAAVDGALAVVFARVDAGVSDDDAAAFAAAAERIRAAVASAGAPADVDAVDDDDE